MTVQASETSVTASVVVEAPIDHAFHVFTEDINSWWNPDHHLLDGEVADMIFEPREGGRVYDVGTDGSECQWARVLVFDPPRQVVFSWDIDPQWQIEADPAKTSEVDVRFVEEGPARTRVELEHRNLDRHGDGWQGVRDAVAADEGWGGGLQRLAARLQT